MWRGGLLRTNILLYSTVVEAKNPTLQAPREHCHPETKSLFLVPPPTKWDPDIHTDISLFFLTVLRTGTTTHMHLSLVSRGAIWPYVAASLHLQNGTVRMVGQRCCRYREDTHFSFVYVLWPMSTLLFPHLFLSEKCNFPFHVFWKGGEKLCNVWLRERI